MNNNVAWDLAMAGASKTAAMNSTQFALRVSRNNRYGMTVNVLKDSLADFKRAYGSVIHLRGSIFIGNAGEFCEWLETWLYEEPEIMGEVDHSSGSLSYFDIIIPQIFIRRELYENGDKIGGVLLKMKKNKLPIMRWQGQIKPTIQDASVL
jgi:hypothetical protein